MAASLLYAGGVGATMADDSTTPPDGPRRVVSLDYCADQYVLKLLDRDRILAVSPDAGKAFSFMAPAAKDVPTVRPRAEDVIILQPDLVVRSYGGGPGATEFFERAGVPVLKVNWASNIDGPELYSIPSVLMHMASGLGVPERGRDLVQQYRKRLNKLTNTPSDQTALYMTPGGVTSGPGSLVHQIITLSGYQNFHHQPGWRSLPLERLAYRQPDTVAASFFDVSTNHPSFWSAARHPVAKAQLQGGDVVQLKGAWTACAGWYVLEAVEALSQNLEAKHAD